MIEARKGKTKTMLNTCLRLALLLATVIFAGATVRASAQQSTTATFEDWVVRCVNRPGPPAKKTCDMEQLTQVKGKNTPLSRVAVTRPAKSAPAKMAIQVPVNIWIPTGIKVQTGSKDAGFAANLMQCIPAGCFADLAITEDMLRQFRTVTTRGRIVFKNAAQRDIDIPLSFKGFGQAFDALPKR